MKFTISSKMLYNAASAVSKVINSKNALMILDNFLLEVKGRELTITGSDRENALTARLELSDVEGSGSFCIGARRLVDLLKELPDQGVEVSFNEETMEVQLNYGAGNYAFVGVPADQYPSFEAVADGAEAISFSLATSQFIEGLDNTMFATATDDSMAILQGVLLDITPESVIYVATDRAKLVRYIDKRTAPDVTGRCIIPAKPSNVIKNVFPKEEVLNFTMTERSAKIESENFTFQCTFLNGRYPDYERVLRGSNPNVLTVDRVAFLNAVRRVGLFVEMEGGLEKFRITAERILLKSNDPALCSSGRESVPCNYSGNELTIGFSSSSLADILATLKSEEVIVNLADASRPATFRPSTEASNTELVMLLAPMSVGEF